MNCPVGTPGDSITVSGAAYSLQPFTVNVAAFSADATPVDLTSQLSVLPTTSISVTPVDKPGPTGAALSYTGATLSSNTAGFPPATVSPKLAVMYDAALGAASWTPPVTMYWRATMNVARASGSATITDTVSSSRVAGSKEGGVRIINGRMLISNGVGSELLKMPVHLQSQYWTGSIWENLISDDVTLVPNSNANTAFTNCQKNLATGAAAPGNCKNALQLQGGSPITLKSGQGTVTMLAPGAGNTGSAMVQITGTQPWLPSTIGQIAFGIYKSSVIYIREVY
jgi:hypothetical protein